jgi:hypothetical protein
VISASRFDTRAFRSILLSTMVIAAGCGSSAATPTEQSQPAETAPANGEESDGGAAPGDATPGTSLTACELVAPADIEAALGLDPGTVKEGTLKQAPTVLDAAANECRYDAQDWGGLVVLATPTDGVNTFNALAKVYGDSGEKLDVADGSYWFEDNDRGYFLKGSVLVIVQFTHIAGGGAFREPSIELGKALVAKI